MEIDELIVRAVGQAREIALLLIEPTGTIRWASSAAEWLLHAGPGALAGLPFSELFTPEDREAGAHDLELQIAMARGTSEDDRWQLRLDGTRFWATGLMYPVWADDGTFLVFAKQMRDRTELREQHEAWRQRHVDAMEAAERREQGIATIAHELRNALMPLASASALIRATAPQDERVERALEVVDRQLAFLGRTVDDLLDAARGAATLDLQLRRVDLRAVLDRAIADARPLIEQRRQVLDQKVPAVAMMVDGDAQRLGQVFGNLLQNAAKYTHVGGRVWAHATIEGNEAVVRVSDDGIGIPPEMSVRIFDLFTRAHPDPGGGLGVGLAVVREVVALHGGTVTGSSPGPGRGSTFTVRLPLAS